MSGLALSGHSTMAVPANYVSSLDIPEDDLPKLISLKPGELFSVLDLNLPGLREVKSAVERKRPDTALAALLKYYRSLYPKSETVALKENAKDKADLIQRANDIENHIFQWGPYPPANYGADINWPSDPAGDIEWIAAMYRFYWLTDLSNAYAATMDERYARAFVELTTDWIKKHPLEVSLNEDHPVYGVAKGGWWRGYAWLDLQTGIRATNLCRAFRLFIHAKAFTPRFLGIILASLYDHQVKTEIIPMAQIHNKAIFEQRGFFNVLHTIREFKDRERWLDIAMKITHENLIAQTTTDGVQREWCGSYHLGVYNDVVEINGRVRDLGRIMPADYQKRVEAMAEHLFRISTPDLSFPMFGDTGRGDITSKDRKTWPLYNTFIEASKVFNDPKYQALADLKPELLPRNESAAFTAAGIYAMRNGWGPEQVYMAVHCSPPAITAHDQADNGTFELYAYGRWLMPDSGYYTYGHDKEGRDWHRQTKVHPTLTVNGEDTNINGIHRLWGSNHETDQLCVENYSYSKFLHRRSFWFAQKRSPFPFFVIVDEAIGDTRGDIELHFPMAPGIVHIDNTNKRITTNFDDANLLIQLYSQHPVELFGEPGWHAWNYGKRERRTAAKMLYKGQAPTVFVSVLTPYKGKTAPDCRLITDPATLIAGQNLIAIEVEVEGKRHRLEREI